MFACGEAQECELMLGVGQVHGQIEHALGAHREMELLVLRCRN